MTEAEILKLSQIAEEGLRDQAAREILYREISRPVFSVAFNILRNREDAEDVLHDVYIKIEKNLAKFEGRSDIRTWIYRIAVNESLSLKRKISRKLRNLLKVAFSTDDMQPERGEKIAMAGEFLENLDDRVRTLMVLKYVEELSFDEISQIMDIPSGTLKSLASRTLKKAAKEYQGG